MGFFSLLLLGLIFLSGSVQAQILLTGIGGKGAGGSAYVGPGDIQSGAVAWYGLRAYSNAVAAPGTNKAIKLSRLADSHVCDILLGSSGSLGLTTNCGTGGENGQSALSWMGTHVTCTGTISGTTLSCTGASGTPVANDMIGAAGVVGLYVSSCGAFVAGVGSCTLNAPPAANISTPEPVNFVNPVTVSTWYDQSGNGFDAVQSVTPLFNPIGVNAVQVQANGVAVQATASDLALHGLQGVVNGASSVINIDGTETTGTTNASAAGNHLCLGSYGHAGGCGTAKLFGSFSELGAWVAVPSGGVRTSMCNNMRLYWGTPGTC